MKKIFCLASLLTMQITSLSQESDVNAPPSINLEAKSKILPLSSYEFYLSLIILGFGLVIMILEFFLIKYRKINSENSIRFVIITLIIISTLFLITAGYDNDQIAPAVGLLGTIAGYLLGRVQGAGKTTHDEKTAV